MMNDEELKRLYAEDQEEHKKLSLLRDETEKAKLQKKIKDNDANRRLLVAELMPTLNAPRPKTAKDYFYAATIYSRGKTQEDQKKAFSLAQKAYNMMPLDHILAEKIKSLYTQTRKKLNNPSPSQAPTNSPLQLKPIPPRDYQKKLQKEKEEAEKLRLQRTCPRCRSPHNGPCPPR